MVSDTGGSMGPLRPVIRYKHPPIIPLPSRKNTPFSKKHCSKKHRSKKRPLKLTANKSSFPQCNSTVQFRRVIPPRNIGLQRRPETHGIARNDQW